MELAQDIELPRKCNHEEKKIVFLKHHTTISPALTCSDRKKGRKYRGKATDNVIIVRGMLINHTHPFLPLKNNLK